MTRVLKSSFLGGGPVTAVVGRSTANTNEPQANRALHAFTPFASVICDHSSAMQPLAPKEDLTPLGEIAVVDFDFDLIEDKLDLVVLPTSTACLSVRSFRTATISTNIAFIMTRRRC
jgi:hypothetical protein